MLNVGIGLIVFGLVIATITFILMAWNMIRGVNNGGFSNTFRNHMIVMAVSSLSFAIGLVIVIWQVLQHYLAAGN